MFKQSKRPLVALAACALAALIATAALAATNNISTIAGTGQHGFAGDGGRAAAATLDTPTDVSAVPGGGYLIADSENDRVRRIYPDGTIRTVAGTGENGFAGDGGPATSAQLSQPTMAQPIPGGGFLIADSGNNRIRRVDAAGEISTVAGNGLTADSAGGGDGGTAVETHLDRPVGVAPAPEGAFLVADTLHHIVWSVASDGSIERLAGTGTAGFSGDGADARSAMLNEPNGVSVTADGGVLVADRMNNRVREVTPDGNIRTAAGNGTAGFSNAADPTKAKLNQPRGVTATADGGFFVADTLNGRVRRVSPAGTISTQAGTGQAGFAGDGRPAVSARLNQPLRVAPTGTGFAFADTGNQRVRLVAPAPLPKQATTPVAPTSALPAPALGKRFTAVPSSGKVRIKVPGGKRFVALGKAASIPVGSVVDTTRGKATLSVARTASGTVQRGTFWSGQFKVAQRKGRRPITDLVLRGGTFKGCKAAKRSSAHASARRKRGRRLWSKVKGRFRTRGRYGAATVRGTQWLTEDRCGGTLVYVRQGLVAVRDRRLRKTFMVPAGKRHFASARAPKRR